MPRVPMTSAMPRATITTGTTWTTCRRMLRSDRKVGERITLTTTSADDAHVDAVVAQPVAPVDAQSLGAGGRQLSHPTSSPGAGRADRVRPAVPRPRPR